MKLLGSTKNRITKYRNGENVPHLKNNGTVLVRWNIVNNDYQHDSIVLWTFVLNKLFRQLLDISPNNFTFLKTFNSEFLFTEVWFTDRNSKQIETENKISITLLIN